MDVQTIDQQYAQLQWQSQQTAQALQTLGSKLQAAAQGGDQQAREWLLDLRELALAFRSEQDQVSNLLQALHGFVANAAQMQNPSTSRSPPTRRRPARKAGCRVAECWAAFSTPGSAVPSRWARASASARTCSARSSDASHGRRHPSKDHHVKHLLLAVSLAAASCLAACAGGDPTTGCHGSASGGSGSPLGNVAGGDGTHGAALGGIAGGGC